MLANFPGSVMARSTGKQQTTNIRVGPGQVAPLDVDGVPLNQAFMPLPYRDVTPGFVSIIQNVEQVAKQLGGTAETAVGEGRNDAPVGTTIALIEQSQKVLNAVHKRLHSAQQKEFWLLKELFRRDPEAIWRNRQNPNFKKDVDQLLIALENNDIVPKADPNTASHTMRVQKAIAIYTLAQQNPSAFDQKAVYSKIFDMIGVEDAQNLFSKAPPGPPPVDETKKMQAQAAMVAAQAKVLEASVRAKQAEGETGVKMANIQTKNMEAATKHQVAKTKAVTDAMGTAAKFKMEKLRLAQSEVVHGDNIKKDTLMKGLDLKHALHNQQHDAQRADLDFDRQREKDMMDAAKEQNQSAAQRLHEVGMANHQADIAREAQFMKPEGTE
jgi:hypothetical protein